VNLDQKNKLKTGDVRVKTRGSLTTLVWKDRREVYMLTNMHPPPAEGNFLWRQQPPSEALHRGTV